MADKPYGDVKYADPKNGKYPIDIEEHIRAAWSYINMPKNAAKYPLNGVTLSEVKARIQAAMKGIGADTSDGESQDDSDSGGRSVPREQEWRLTPGVIEVRALSDGKQRIGGYGAVFGKESRPISGFVERVAPTAFNQSKQLGWPGVVCRLNHDKNQLLGTSEARTLTLRTDNIGLDYEVEPPQFRSDIVELVARGDIRNSSFAFHCPRGGDEWRANDQGYPLRILHEVRLLDVAPVTGDEAYTDSTVGLRSLAAAMDAPFEEVRSLADADNLRKFFTRTDNRGPAPASPLPSGPQAMMRLMEKRHGPGGLA